MDTIFGLLIGLGLIVAFIGLWFALFRKAGYETGRSVSMAIGMLVPLGNFGLLIYFVSTTWPIQAELASLRAKAGVGSEDDAQALMSDAIRLESRGDVTAAIAQYDLITKRFADTDSARDAEASIRSLKAKIG